MLAIFNFLLFILGGLWIGLAWWLVGLFAFVTIVTREVSGSRREIIAITAAAASGAVTAKALSSAANALRGLSGVKYG